MQKAFNSFLYSIHMVLMLRKNPDFKEKRGQFFSLCTRVFYFLFLHIFITEGESPRESDKSPMAMHLTISKALLYVITHTNKSINYALFGKSYLYEIDLFQMAPIEIDAIELVYLVVNRFLQNLEIHKELGAEIQPCGSVQPSKGDQWFGS